MDANFLVSNLEETVRHTLANLSDNADEVQLAVAYVSDSDLIEGWLKRPVAVKLVVALQPPTDAAILRGLVNAYRSAQDPSSFLKGLTHIIDLTCAGKYQNCVVPY
jgi:hypothetical protein